MKDYGYTNSQYKVIEQMLCDDILVEQLRILVGERAAYTQEEIYQTDDGQYRLVTPSTLPVGLKAELDEYESINEAFLSESHRLQLGIELNERRLSEWGSSLMCLQVGLEHLEPWMQDALAYYLPIAEEVRDDDRLFEAMLNDVFNAEVEVVKVNRPSPLKGSLIQKLILGKSIRVGGRVLQLALRCCFKPKNETTYQRLLSGGDWHRFITEAIFPLFVSSAYVPKLEIVTSNIAVSHSLDKVGRINCNLFLKNLVL